MGKKPQLSEAENNPNLEKNYKKLQDNAAKKKALPKKKEKASIHVPRGQRTDFLRITLTIPGDLLMGLRVLGTKRKSTGGHDTDTSSLIREALVDFLNKHKDS